MFDYMDKKQTKVEKKSLKSLNVSKKPKEVPQYILGNNIQFNSTKEPGVVVQRLALMAQPPSKPTDDKLFEVLRKNAQEYGSMGIVYDTFDASYFEDGENGKEIIELNENIAFLGHGSSEQIGQLKPERIAEITKRILKRSRFYEKGEEKRVCDDEGNNNLWLGHIYLMGCHTGRAYDGEVGSSLAEKVNAACNAVIDPKVSNVVGSFLTMYAPTDDDLTTLRRSDEPMTHQLELQIQFVTNLRSINSKITEWITRYLQSVNGDMKDVYEQTQKWTTSIKNKLNAEYISFIRLVTVDAGMTTYYQELLTVADSVATVVKANYEGDKNVETIRVQLQGLNQSINSLVKPALLEDFKARMDESYHNKDGKRKDYAIDFSNPDLTFHTNRL